jgi:uncharacterized protein (DUF58 family)
MSELNESAPITEQGHEQQQGPKYQTSVLFERYAPWVVLAMLAAFIWFRIIPLMVVSSFFLLILMVVTMWRKHALRHVIPTIGLTRQRVFAGEEISLNLTLNNNKWLPLVWIEIEQEPESGITWGDDAVDHYRIRFLWLLWYQKVAWTAKGKAHRRGVYRLARWRLRSGDGFRFTEEERQMNVPSQLYVYPRLMSVHVPSLTALVQWGKGGKNGGFLVDHQLVQSVRNYQHGDEWRSIHWQASAKSSILQTKIFQPVLVRQLMLFIDVAEFDSPKRSADFERFLSIIASVIIAYHNQGVRIGLASNALDLDGNEIIPSVSAGTSLTELLDHLAVITPKLSMERKHVQQYLKSDKLSVPIYICCESLREDHHRWYGQYKKDMPFVFYYYMKESRLTHLFTGAAKRLDSFLS